MADPVAGFAPIHVVIEDEDGTTVVDPQTGTVTTPQSDGGVVVHLDAHRPESDNDDDENEFYENLADKIDPVKLSIIANDLHDAIAADDNSRQEYLNNRAKGLDLLGIKLADPRSSVSDSAAPMDGMSSVTNPLLLENVVKGWANTVGELLPAAGPVKIEDDAPDGGESVTEDERAEALQRDMNHYLTKVDKPFYADISHMILWGPYFGGSGFVKVYRDPMRRRPVARSVDCKDLIVSDATKDFDACERITHESKVRPSVLKRMQHVGAYRQIPLSQPTPSVSVMDNKIAMIQGVNPTHDRPEDQPYTIWECQCELDLPQGFDHPSMRGHELKEEGIPLPYVVTIDKDSREIYAIRRDWKEPAPDQEDNYDNDSECERKRMYVRFPYIPGPGFYGTGMLNLLGNASAAMTAAWRMGLDAGMFANFAGGFIDEAVARQNTSNMRAGPSEWLKLQLGGRDIRQVAIPFPYKDVTPGLMAMIDKIQGQADKLGGAADIPAGEGLQNIPVGTMLAQIEQATKVMSAAHKGMHTAMSEVFDMLLDLFRDNPKDFWRNNKVAPKDYWTEEKFLQALNDYNLVPVSDPNVPSHIHRIMKAVALLQLSTNPLLAPLTSAKELYLRCLRALKEDPAGLVVDPQPQAAPPDPKAISAQADVIEAQAKSQKAQADAALSQGKLAALPQENQLEAAKLQTQRDIASTDLAKESIIHQGDTARLQHEMTMDRAGHALEATKTMADIAHTNRQHGLDVASATHDAAMDHATHQLAVHQALNPPEPKGGGNE